MALETGEFVNNLVDTNPPGSDDKRQGDDHLRLIKKVLKKTFPNATKAYYFPGVIAVAGPYSITALDENKTIVCSTAGAGAGFSIALPPTASLPLGWKVKVVKNDVANIPVFIVPTSGTINGYDYIRRSVPYVITEIQWVGTWVASRPNGLPVGTVIEWWGTTPPNGYLLCDGSTVNSSAYRELFAQAATLPNHSGRSVIGRDTTGAGLVTGLISGINSTLLGAAGGFEGISLSLDQTPLHSHALLSSNLGGSASAGMDDQLGTHLHGWGTLGSNGSFTTTGSATSGFNLNHAHFIDTSGTTTVQSGGGAPNIKLGTTSAGLTTSSSVDTGYNLDHAHTMSIGGNTSEANLAHRHTITLSGSTQGAGGSAFHINVQPSIVMTKIIVAE